MGEAEWPCWVPKLHHLALPTVCLSYNLWAAEVRKKKITEGKGQTSFPWMDAKAQAAGRRPVTSARASWDRWRPALSRSLLAGDAGDAEFLPFLLTLLPAPCRPSLRAPAPALQTSPVPNRILHPRTNPAPQTRLPQLSKWQGQTPSPRGAVPHPALSVVVSWVATITNDHELDGLKQQKCICCPNSEKPVWAGLHPLCRLRRGAGTGLPCLLPSFWWLQAFPGQHHPNLHDYLHGAFSAFAHVSPLCLLRGHLSLDVELV